MTLAGLSQLDIKLREAGIPIHGVSGGAPPVVNYKPEATQAQRDAGDAMAASFVPRRLRSIDAIATSIEAVIPPSERGALRNAILRRLEANYVQEHPEYFAAYGVLGDEPDI